MQIPTKRPPRSAAFTLIELLVVMAITVILLGLIFGPLVQGFNLTNRARIQILTQEVARRQLETIKREISNAAYIFDPTSQAVNLWTPDPGGLPLLTPLPYAMLDIVPPARENDQNAAIPPGDIDPTTGLPFDRGNIAAPLAPGRVIVRYWVGLKENATQDESGYSGRPRKLYRNFYDNVRVASHSDHNPLLLYRATVSPFNADGTVDERLFRKDAQGRPILFDANFFYDNGVAPGGAAPGWRDLNNDSAVNFSENWRAVARPQVPVDRADLAIVTRGEDGNPVYYVDPGTNQTRMKIASSVSFQPTYVGNDAGVPTSEDDTGNESPGIAAATQRESYGHWTTPYKLYVFRSPMGSQILKYFYWEGLNSDIRYREFDTASGQITLDESANFNPLAVPQTLAPGQSPRILFTTDSRRGLVNFSFPHSITQTSPNRQPATYDPGVANAEHDYVASLDIDKLSSIRYLTLLDFESMTNPAGLDPSLNPFGKSPLGQIVNCRVVPGSERVYGPDMNPGSTYGYRTLYRRAPANTDPNDLGPNEYLIRYEALRTAIPYTPTGDPRVDAMEVARRAAGTIIFPSGEGVPGGPKRIPRIDANNDGIADVPITVDYKIQNNLRTDVVKADYLTRQLMTLNVGIRLYDFSSGQPQQFNVSQKIHIRNLQR